MKGSERERSPWQPSAYFTNGGLLLLVGVLLISGSEIAPLGYLLAVIGGVMVLIGAINKGTSHSTNDRAD
jgi:hypothetical protein